MNCTQPYDHNPTTGHIKQTRQDTPTGEICKTSFKYKSVKSLLDVYPNADEFRIGQTNISGQDYFTISAYTNGQKQEEIVGEYPCPEDCYPPFIPESFCREHVESVMGVPGCELFNVHKCKRRLSNTFSLFCIYAVIYVGGQPISLDKEGDPIYVSEPY